MKRDNTLCLPEGLPARFADPETGFSSLCEFLGIATRSDQQQIVNIEPVKRAIRSHKLSLRNLSTSKRLRVQITTFYGMPAERRSLWQAILKADPANFIPSLEYQALKNYDPEFLERELDERRLGESFSDFLGVDDAISGSPKWQRPALAAWLNIRSDLLQWETLAPSRRDAATLATFAVATILDEVRFLEWAAGQAEVLSIEYQFALNMNVDEAGALGEQREEPGKPVEDETSAVVKKWNETCRVVADMAAALAGDPPRPENFDSLIGQVHALESLREPLLEMLDARRPEKLLERVALSVSEAASHDGMSWLSGYGSMVLAQWQLYYLAQGEANIEQVQQDVERVERELKQAASEWQRMERARQSCQGQLQALEVSAREPGDLLTIDDRKVELQEELVEATKQLRDARRRIFQVIAPHDQEFDPSKDYERACEDLGVFRTERVHEGPAHESVERPERESDEGVVEATTSMPETEGVHEASEDLLSASEDEQQRVAISDDLSVTGKDRIIEGATPEPDAIDIESSVQFSTSTAGESQPLGVVEPMAAEGVNPLAAAEPGEKSYGQNTAAVAMLWQAFDAGRPGIAYHIAKLLAEHSDNEQAIPPANLIAASILANYLQSSESDVARAIGPFLERIDPDSLWRNEWPDRDAINLLLFSATLRSALFVPATDTASLLRRVSVPEDLTPLYELATVVIDHADRLQGIQLNATLLTTTLRGSWQDEFRMFTARVEDWRNRAELRRNLFYRARLVWTDLLSGNGVLGELIALMVRDDAANASRVKEIQKQIDDQRSFNDLVQKTDRGSRKGDPIQGRALKQLWDHMQPAIELSNEWLRLMDAQPDPKGFVAQQVEALRSDIIQYGGEATFAIDQMLEKETSVALIAALKHARCAIDALLQAFDDDSPLAEQADTSSDVVLSRDLLYVTGLDLDTEFRPAAGSTTAGMLDLLLDLDTHARTMSDAFYARLSRGDLIGAQLACSVIDAESPEADQCQSSLDQEAEHQRLELKAAYAAEEARLEGAFCRGLLDTNERDDFASRLVSLKRSVQRMSSLDVVGAVSAKSDLAHIQQAIEKSSSTRIDKARSRFKAVVSANPGTSDLTIVEQAIESGEIFTANELMSRLEDGESINLPDMTGDPFQEFVSVLGEIDEELEKLKGSRHQAVVRQAAARGRIAGVSFEDLSEQEAELSASLLRTWYELARQRRFDEGSLQRLLRQLGFRVLDVSTDPARGRSQARITTEIIEDRTICPSRQFGSEARGRYRVLVDWNRPAYESITESLGSKVGDPTVVLYFGCLGAEREKLRAYAIQTHRLFLVVDDSLILFLAARPSGRLSSLFRSALPFTSITPYATTSGLVPPELFYGRDREQREINDPSGACFLYGGRQLGKTALLRRVERDFNRSSETNRAKWIDLKVNEIGYARGPRDIWPLLQRELVSVGVVRKPSRELDPGNQRQVDSLFDQIRRWINEHENRRLLLLLDEADAFLEQDARTQFRESAKLKGLMDETERRCKVVFAGLHNVLRTTRQANHPLAHFGDPIRVGAMLSNGEWRQAQALVREPLQAAGCRFERDELSTRILAHTNYFPSLIQLYGAELVRQLRDSSKEFPYVIDDDDIHAAYSSQELGSAIRDRFHLTLQLDQRYEVIAYALTQELQGDTDLGQGLDIDTIAASARAWWPEGFETTDMEFSMLLREMEGLGVLRSRDQGRRYTFRNPNILMLLGNSEDIEKALDKERQPPPAYEPASFRARYPQNRLPSARRGPLTYRQESDLRAKGGVAVICGCNAAGLEHVSEFLQQRIAPEYFQTFPPVSDLDEFEQELKALKPVRKVVTIFLVPPQADWNPSWIKVAERVLRGKARGQPIRNRIVFIATPERLWQTMAAESDLRNLDWIEIGPWDKRFLRHWLDDINLTADESHVNELMEVSAGWPVVLDRFVDKPLRKSWSTRINELILELPRDLPLKEFGADTKEVERLLRMLQNLSDPGDNIFDSDSIEIVSDELSLNDGEVSMRVKWSERLGLVSCTGQGCWTFNPLVRRLLEPSDTA